MFIKKIYPLKVLFKEFFNGTWKGYVLKYLSVVAFDNKL